MGFGFLRLHAYAGVSRMDMPGAMRPLATAEPLEEPVGVVGGRRLVELAAHVRGGIARRGTARAKQDYNWPRMHARAVWPWKTGARVRAGLAPPCLQGSYAQRNRAARPGVVAAVHANCARPPQAGILGDAA